MISQILIQSSSNDLDLARNRDTANENIPIREVNQFPMERRQQMSPLFNGLIQNAAEKGQLNPFPAKQR